MLVQWTLRTVMLKIHFVSAPFSLFSATVTSPTLLAIVWPEFTCVMFSVVRRRREPLPTRWGRRSEWGKSSRLKTHYILLFFTGIFVRKSWLNARCRWIARAAVHTHRQSALFVPQTYRPRIEIVKWDMVSASKWKCATREEEKKYFHTSFHVKSSFVMIREIFMEDC